MVQWELLFMMLNYDVFPEGVQIDGENSTITIKEQRKDVNL